MSSAPQLLAISDLHLSYPENRALLQSLPPSPGDWLILAGDVGEAVADLKDAIDILADKFARLIWVPGNHELWTTPRDPNGLRGPAKYQALVELCRERSVLCPEDPYPVFEGAGGPCRIAPLFLLYDYSFSPSDVPPSKAVAWARQAGLRCADEDRIDPWPHASFPEWCHHRIAQTTDRLEKAAAEHPLVLINHFPLRYDLATLPRIPRFSIWCGTRRTENWHLTYRANVVVSGHLHIRNTQWRDGVRFEEVSLGYPREKQRQRITAESAIRTILPSPSEMR